MPEMLETLCRTPYYVVHLVSIVQFTQKTPDFIIYFKRVLLSVFNISTFQNNMNVFISQDLVYSANKYSLDKIEMTTTTFFLSNDQTLAL